MTVNAQLLVTLADRLAVPGWPPGTAEQAGTPGPPHPETLGIGGRVTAWAEDMGLVLGDPDACPLGRARFERLAGRIFPGEDPDRVALFARWLLWFFALDDAIDDTPLGGSATSVLELYGGLRRALRRGHATPEARPLEVALVDLWSATAPGMGLDWRRRFLEHLDEHRDGCAAEAVNRRTGRTPELGGYAALRRRAAGPFLYDLAEPVLGTELPAALGTGGPWNALVAAIADIVTWTNDIVSYPREAARRDPHNLVTVITAALGFEPARATVRVVDYVTRRLCDVRTAARVLYQDLDRRADNGPADRVVGRLLAVPRAHLDWLLESGRYTGRSPAVPPPRLGASVASGRM